jgi:hypothetical protein
MALRPGTMPLHFKGYILIPFALFLTLNLAEIRDMFMPAAVERVSRSVMLVKRDINTRVDGVRPESVLREALKETSTCYYNYLASSFTLRAIIRPGEVIMTRKPEVVALITESYALRFPFTAKTEEFKKFIDDRGVDYILLDGCYDETRRFLIPFVEENSDMFSVWMYEGKNTGILKVEGK